MIGKQRMSSQIEIDLGGLLPVGEKRKLLNQFIIKAEKSQVNDILEKCKNLPSIQYNLLKFLLADKFRRFDLIIELLYNEDSPVIRTATSKRWLYEDENSAFIDSDFLMSKLFPNISYSCRQKVLYRIGRYLKNEEKADKIWNAVEQKYGFDAAFQILQACSKEKINSSIASRKVELSGYQLVQILQKYPDIGLRYFKNHLTKCIGSTSKNSYRSPWTYLYKNHPEDFLDLCLNHYDKMNSFKFGRKRSTKMIRNYREKLLEKPAQTSSLMKTDRIRREFSAEEFQTLFESSLGTTVPSNDDMWTWVKIVPKYKRVDMVNRAFMKVFQVNLDEHYEFMSTEYIILLPDEKRLSVVQWKSENDQNYGWTFRAIYEYAYRDDDKKRSWLPLKPISHSVPEIQKLLFIEQDVAGRASLSRYLIETCYINQDLTQLLNVLLLLSKRLRNDHADVRIAIFQTLNKIMCKFEFRKEHWDVIIEMIQVSLIMIDNRDYSDGDKEKLIEKCIAYHIASKLPEVNNLIVMHIKLKIKTSTSYWTNDYIKNEADRRSLLELYTKELEHLQLTNDLRSHEGHVLESERLTEFIANLIEEICKFNKNATKLPQKLKPISIASHQWLRTSLEKIAKDEEDRINKNHTSNSSYSWNFARQLVNIIQALRKEQNISLDAFNDSAGLFTKILHTSPCSSILMYFLGKNPSQLIESWPTTLSKMLKSESGLQFMWKLKTWNYSTLIAQAVETCSGIIGQTLDHNSECTIKQKCNAVSVLSVLSKYSDFLSLAEQFYPAEKKVDVFADNSKEDYQIREAVAKSLINVSVSHLAFPAIEKYCVGDYLKLGIAALYSHSGRASEEKSLNFLHQKLVNTPVSLQKHIIRLYFGISSVEQKIGAFKVIESSNATIRYELFLRANKLLKSSPSPETWTILKTVIENTTEEDAAIVQYLHTNPKLDACPYGYMSGYIITCLAMITKVKPEKTSDFMRLLEVIMDKLPEKTLDDIILNKGGEQTTFSSTFCIKYIYDSSSESVAEHRLSNMWTLLQNVIRNGWNVKTPRHYDLNSFDYQIRTAVFDFILNLLQTEADNVSRAWLKEKTFRTLLEKFKAESATKFFKEAVYLELGLLLVKEIEKPKMERLKPFGRSLGRLTDTFVEEYGGEIIFILKDSVKAFVDMYCYDEHSRNTGAVVELIDGILETSKTRSNQIISIALLDSINPKSSKLVATCEKIKTSLEESNDVVAQIYYGSVTF